MSTVLAAQDALLATCRAYANGSVFTEANSSLNDWQVLDAPGTEYGLVIETGPTEEGDSINNRGSQGMYQEVHRPRIHVTKKVGTGQQGYAQIINDLQATVEGLKDHIRIYNRLSSPVVSRAVTARTSESLDVIRKGGSSPMHQMQRIEMVIYCESDVPEEDEGGY